MTIREQIEQWLQRLQQDLTDNYGKMGLKVSGKWEKDLETFIDERSQGFHFGIKGASYTYQLEHGRGPNVNQSQQALLRFVRGAGSTFLADWVKRKGISVNPFAAAWKIAREGIKIPNRYNPGGLVSDIITDERTDKLIKDIGLIFSTQIKSDVIKTLKK